MSKYDQFHESIKISVRRKLWRTLKIGTLLGIIAGLLVLGYKAERKTENRILLAHVMKLIADKGLLVIMKVMTNIYFYGTLLTVLLLSTVLQLVYILLLKKKTVFEQRSKRWSFLRNSTNLSEFESNSSNNESEEIDLGSLQSLLCGTLKADTLKKYRNGELLETEM